MNSLTQIRFPVLRSVEIVGYALFPGVSDEGTGFTHDFENGVSVIAGINGLGKTTLLNALLRLLIGPWDVLRENPDDVGSTQHTLIPWRSPTYFSARVPDGATSATIAGRVSFGEETIYVIRSLRDLSIQQLRRGTENITPEDSEYQKLVVSLSGVSNYYDFHFMVRNLLFYLEERRPLVWSENGQFEIARILYIPGEESTAFSKLYDSIKTVDSRYRNLLTETNRLVKRLREQKRAERAQESNLAQITTLKHAYLNSELALEEVDQSLEQAIDEERASAGEIRRTQLELESAFRGYEGLQQSFFALAYPDASETFHYFLGHIVANGGCLVCGSQAKDKAAELKEQIAHGTCPICGSAPSKQERLVSTSLVAVERLNVASRDLNRKRSTIQALAEQNTDLRKRIDELLERRGVVAEEMEEYRRRLAAMGARLPASATAINELEASVKVNQENLSVLLKDRTERIGRYRRMVADVSNRMTTAIAEIRSHFKEYVRHFLAETCELNFRFRRRPVGESGETVDFPGFDIMMTSGVFPDQPRPRENRDDISESQKEFVDLAFRMALIRTAAPADAGAMLVLETPESSLDSLFIYRAGNLLRQFADGGGAIGNVLVATSNLNEANMIPALLGIDVPPGMAAEDIRRRLINLLDLAAPNAALVSQGKAYRSQYTRATSPDPNRLRNYEGTP